MPKEPKQVERISDFLTTGRKRESIERSTRRSQAWLKNQIKNFQEQTRKSQTSRPAIGNMYLFNYSAKWDGDKRLPYWDRFPLILMVGPAKGGFYGLNLHYLPPRKRIVLLNKLIDVSNIKSINENTRLRITYGIIKSATNLYKPTFKHYLFSQTRSKLIKVPATDWNLMASLPLANLC